MSESGTTGGETAAPAGEHQHGADAAHGGHGVPAAVALDQVFDREDIAQFDQDDVTAGRVLCKLLSLFFLYTLIAMGFVAWLTRSGIME
jgi:hypothetical protein